MRIFAHGFSASICFVATLATQAAAFAQTDENRPRPIFTAPFPPARPAEFAITKRQLDPSPVPTAPLTASPMIPRAVAATALPLSRSLPPVPRERMRACGLEWQAKKLSGAAGDKTWRDFALTCLIN
jgi:hypothetical protein